MPAQKPQKPGPPEEPRFTIDALVEGFRYAVGLRGIHAPGKIRTALDFARLAGSRGISPLEYFSQYNFHHLPKMEQESFITILEAQKITWKLSREIRDVFWHKDRFLTAFFPYVRREWARVRPGEEEFFHTLCKKHPRLIIKPRASTEGRGIRILEKEHTKDPVALFQQLLVEDCIAEEVLYNDERLCAFNPDSLNTVRVVTLYNGSHFEVYGAVIRFGRKGSVVDNISSGGLYAALDAKTGIIISQGMEMSGKCHDKHPDSGKEFLGFAVPRWDMVLDLVQSAVTVLPNIRIAGWDVALLREGGIALVEGNHMPDFDMLQQPKQKGIKQEFEYKVRELFGAQFLA